MENYQQESGMGLVYTASLPVEIKVLTEEPDTISITEIQQVNYRVLRQVLTLEEQVTDTQLYHDDSRHGTRDIQRVEAKVDLLLDLLGGLIQLQIPKPMSRKVIVSNTAIQIAGIPADFQSQSGWLMVLLYLHAYSIEPLRILVNTGTNMTHVGDQQFRMHFAHFTDGERDLLEKIIFRHHRKSIARNR